jgi:4-alpha-glucanotransferase
MNTHDMPTFASFRRGDDLRDLAALGLMSDDTQAAEDARRAAKLRVLRELLRHGGWLLDDAGGDDDQAAAHLLRAALRYLADSDAAAVIVNLEDLWLEERPQNVPGTSSERPNWRRRARYTLADMMSLPAVVDALRELDARRRAGRSGVGP